MAGCTGCVVNTVQAVLHALVAVAWGILAEICGLYTAEGGATVPINDVSIVAGLVAHNHAISASLGAGIARTVEGKAQIAGRASD